MESELSEKIFTLLLDEQAELEGLQKIVEPLMLTGVKHKIM
jgi:hypothetical protein